MRRGKRLLAISMAAIMGLSLAACGNKDQTDVTTTEETSDTTESTEEASTEEDLIGVNQITNGDFSNDLSHWSMYTNGGSAVQAVTADKEMQIAVTNIGTVEHAIQPYYDGFKLDTGCQYEFSFDVHSDVERTIEWRLQMNGGDYHAYESDRITVNEEVQHVDCTFTYEEGSDPAPRLCINMGNLTEDADKDLGSHNVYFDNFSLVMLDNSNIVVSDDTVETSDINVDQIGYQTTAVKKAVVRSSGDEAISGDFKVVNTETNETVFTGTLTDAKRNTASEEQTATADFSDLTEEGTYKIVTDNYGESFEFQIADDVYSEVSESVLHMLYLQRCGMEVEDDTFGHEACHTGEAVLYGEEDGKTYDVSGGWHDAGDYGRYVVSGAKTCADLMLSYEIYGDVYGDDTGIPESGNGVPDILDETRYELEWMLKMQDTSGGVYHKVTCKNFPETVMPEDETDQLIIMPVSTTATGDFAATLAMAARVYQDVDKTFADTCLAASEKAYEYMASHEMEGIGYENPDDIATGEYPDKVDRDERFWMSAELYKTTGDLKYLDDVLSYDANGIGGGLGWQSVGFYGMYAYLSTDGQAKKNKDFYNSIKTRFFKTVDTLVENSEEDAYGVSLSSSDYCWGSNMSVANNGMILLMADEIDSTDKYMDVARQQLDYILGTNTNSYCFVTGFGTLNSKNPHHRPSEYLETAMPGMLIGGPDSNLEDPYAKATLSENAPAACYVDNVQSYSCNEVTIYWNSPLIFLLSGVEE